MTVKKILVPTDGSTFTKNAVESAIETSKLTGASITAVYVVDASSMSTARGDMFESVTEILNEEGQEAVAAVKAQCDAAGIQCERGSRARPWSSEGAPPTPSWRCPRTTTSS